MAGALEGIADFTYEGRNYRFVIGNRVWFDAEKVLGYSFLDAAENLMNALRNGKNPELRTLLAIAYAGLLEHHPDIEEQGVIDMFMSGSKPFREALFSALEGVQLPDADADEEGDAGKLETQNRTDRRKAKQAGTGKKSSKPGVKRDGSQKGSGNRRRARR